MENFFDRFGVLLIAVVILIVKAIFRQTTATPDNADTSDTPQRPNAADFPDAPGAPMRNLAGADAQTGEAQRPVSPADVVRMAMQRHAGARKAELQTGRGSRQSAPTFSASKSSPKRRQQPASPTPSKTPEPSTPDRNKWMEGFDIRRAVVWSEILRPKFKEDEA